MKYQEKKAMPETERADWRDDTLYDGRKDWSNRCWAWEFLRRNVKYQKLCAEKRRVSPHRKRKFAAEFGRCDLKPHYHSYGAKEDNENHWLSETIMRMKAHDEYDEKEQIAMFNLSPGDVAMVFNLGNTRYGGKAAITAQLNHAKTYLLKELIKFEVDLSEEQASKIQKPHRKLWPLLIRLYDAKVHCNASVEEIIQVLYTSEKEKGKELDPIEKIAIRKKISAHFKRAKEMVETGYLQLVALDFIQDRTEK
jgi:hypothetical protein